ncbi:MAG: hypothetical protein ACX94A_06110 [Algiphilus sp.]
MSKNKNSGSQSGDGSINVGGSDLRGAQLHVGDNYTGGKPQFTPEELNLQRKLVIEKRLIKRESLSLFGWTSGLASIGGLYFAMFPFGDPTLPAGFHFVFLIMMGLGWSAVLASKFLKQARFIPFLFRRFYLELGTRDGVFLSRFVGTCPWCGSSMKLRNLGPKNGPRDDILVCQRNPKQHTVLLDPTLSPDIEEL